LCSQECEHGTLECARHECVLNGVGFQSATEPRPSQFVGANQINVVVPKLPNLGVVPLQIQDGNVLSSDKATIASSNP
jgi:hypothetical protein